MRGHYQVIQGLYENTLYTHKINNFLYCYYPVYSIMHPCGVRGKEGGCQEIGTINVSFLDEVSGIAMSRHREDVFWVLNDSGNSASVYAIGLGGKPAGVVNIAGLKIMTGGYATFEFEGKPYIVVADVGITLQIGAGAFFFYRGA
jgi:hypothetical protein